RPLRAGHNHRDCVLRLRWHLDRSLSPLAGLAGPAHISATSRLTTGPRPMTDAATDPKPDKLAFQAEVSRPLDIVTPSHSSERPIFLRELISNASDACDRLRYAALTQPELTAGDAEFRITLTVNKAGRRLTVSDNGVGMNREDLVENLGTIARSGTAAFVNSLSGDAK